MGSESSPTAPATTQRRTRHRPLSFSQLGLDASLARHLQHRLQLAAPTRIQAAVLHALLPRQRQLLGGEQVYYVRADTGTGKTLAYLLPLAHSMLACRRQVARTDGTLALVLAPTRELCLQVEEVARALLRPYHWLVVTALMGGEKRKSEKARLRHGTAVVIGTPGRVLDHLQQTRSWRLDQCKWVVLDEADRLLDMGFGDAVRRVRHQVQTLSAHRGNAGEVVAAATTPRGPLTLLDGDFGTVLVAATVREDVQALAEARSSAEEHGAAVTMIDDAATISADTAYVSGAPQVSHFYAVVPPQRRLVALACLLWALAHPEADALPFAAAAPEAPRKAVVFLSTCDSVELHHALLSRLSSAMAATPPWLGCSLLKMHGEMPQPERVSAFRQFRAARRGTWVLLCTDVAARGLDIQHLTLCVQYDPPTRDDHIEYLHRAGRTSRLGSAGHSLTLLQPHESEYAALVQSRLGVPLQSLDADRWIAATGMSAEGSAAERARACIQALQNSAEAAVRSDASLQQLAEAAYRAYLCSYRTRAKPMRQVFDASRLHLGHLARAFALSQIPNGDDAHSAKRRRRHSERETSSGVPAIPAPYAAKDGPRVRALPPLSLRSMRAAEFAA
ncbi:hypothetical protein CDCA_CDCA20G4761 [Cyanidium caldarium]|uniref:ATP-dependent RNA helicase n=1 Tax=Cyanidium caldarium TaxID=2771 RepID=A0AAV9J368_CYACA|nr:hypothetical protein CDCA_CDCA20G4761 [Cyanidium caldarium]